MKNILYFSGLSFGAVMVVFIFISQFSNPDMPLTRFVITFWYLYFGLFFSVGAVAWGKPTKKK